MVKKVGPPLGEHMRYEFKQIKQAVDQAPSDFVREEPAPIALLD